MKKTMKKYPRIVVAGTHSGCGKTTVASGIMAALAARGIPVQGFKAGPDFIDPSHHSVITGRPSRNLDPYLMGDKGVRETFYRASEGAGISVIEGVMGLFDGVDGTDFASTAHIAKILEAPVILVIDAKGMSRSVHAQIQGFRNFDPALRLAGVIFNRVGSQRHREMIASSLSVPCFGWIPRREDLATESRHLGLRMGSETSTMKAFGSIVEEFCDVPSLIAAAGDICETSAAPSSGTPRKTRSRIGVGLDEAFCFYYQDNLDRLRLSGGELVFFSPMRDPLPDVDAVYLGGGYPELHLPALESSPCTGMLKKAAEKGMPMYAECGGLLYLARELGHGKQYRMCGVLPATARMTPTVQALGYVSGTSANDPALFLRGLTVRGHEFHYSRVEPDRDARFALVLSRGKGVAEGKDWLVSGNAIGSYTHAYFSRKLSLAFVEAGRKFACPS
ncbi:MAG TPA: cobyrinate a,c-diamide synthase [Methanoregula sp.]|nr:cobyrinate a,c-diamide synthase [Methanoregula sp.]